MPLFGSKKKVQTGKFDVESAISKGRIQKIVGGGDLEQEGLDVEMFHIAALISRTSGRELDDLEKALFGKTFGDLLKGGYRPSVTIKDDDGVSWWAHGKLDR